EAEAQRRWQGRNRRRTEKAVGGETGGGEGGTSRCKEVHRQESAGEGFPEGREEGCREATTESRRDSCWSGSDRVAPPNQGHGSLAQRGRDRFRVKNQEGKGLGAF